MDIRLQRMMLVLFLILVVIAVTILFWLPVNDDSSRILIAKNTGTQEPYNNLAVEVAPIEDEIPLELDELPAAADAVVAENDLSEEYDDTDYVASKAEEAVKPSSVPVQTSGSFAYDVMGNKRSHITDYTVKKDDWFAKITGKYWKDLFMWPDLYTINIGNPGSADNLESTDPDLIYPGETVSVYESLVADGEFSEEDRRTLLSAYLKVYKIYKQLGERKELATAQLLAAAVRYDKDFLENYSSVIAAKDAEMAQTLIKEQKFLD